MVERFGVRHVALSLLAALAFFAAVASTALGGQVSVSFRLPSCQWDGHAGEYVCKSGTAMCDSVPSAPLTDLAYVRVWGRRFSDKADSLLGVVDAHGMEGKTLAVSLDIRCGSMGVVWGEAESAHGGRWPLEQSYVFALPWDGRLPR